YFPFFAKEILEGREGLFELPGMEWPNQVGQGKDMNRQLSGALINLALISGTFSRFKLDKRLRENEFGRLYTQWIQNALGGKDRVLVYIMEKTIGGFITLLPDNGRGRIGLMAVEEKFRGIDMGTQLLQAAIEVTRQEGLE